MEERLFVQGNEAVGWGLIWVGATGILPPELIEKQLATRFGGREQVLIQNLKAFREGLKLAQMA